MIEVGAHDNSSRRLWLPVPGLALRVRVAMDAESELDELARTILRFLQIRDPDTDRPRARRADELARKLGLERARDLVDVALRALEDRYLIEPVEEGSEVYQLATDNVEELQGATIRPAWAFVLPGNTPQILPRLWFGDKVPGRRGDATVGDRDFSEEHQDYFETFAWKKELDNDRELSRLLQGLVRRKDLLLCENDDESGEEPGEPVELPTRLGAEALKRNMVLRSIEIDHVARQKGHDFMWTTLWVQVDLLPRIADPAVTVYHRPDIEPISGRIRPISDSIERWLNSHEKLRPMSDYVQGQAEAMKKEFSLVLKTAGIESEAELEAAVDEHLAELQRKTRLSAPMREKEVLQRGLTAKCRDAWRWLYISRKSARYVRVARDSYAHAVEALAQGLRDLALSDLQGWQNEWAKFETKAERKRFKKPRTSVGWRSDRLGMIEISASELGPSLGHLESALERIHKLPGSIDNAAEQGAGNSISLWLLPIFLLGDDGAARYALPLRYALDQEPLLFEYLATLIDMRNQVFHDRPEDVELLDEVDRRFFTVWAAIDEGYRVHRELHL